MQRHKSHDLCVAPIIHSHFFQIIFSPYCIDGDIVQRPTREEDHEGQQRSGVARRHCSHICSKQRWQVYMCISAKSKLCRHVQDCYQLSWVPLTFCVHYTLSSNHTLILPISLVLYRRDSLYIAILDVLKQEYYNREREGVDKSKAKVHSQIWHALLVPLMHHTCSCWI